ILSESNFERVGIDQQYLIQKFLARTLLYNQRLKKEVKQLEFKYIEVDSVSMPDELAEKCMELMSV
ncbi:MAG: 2-phosphoglycerate kinase, partial [Waterburya sp.]